MSERKSQPSSRMCFVCGVENPVGFKLHIYETGPGKVETTYTAPEHFQGYPDILHGGIIATLIDEVSGRTLMSSSDEPRFMFTAKLEVTYRHPVPTGKPLKIIGKMLEDKGRKAEAWAGIYLTGSEELLAEGKTLLVNVPKDKFDLTDLEGMGWKVYPEIVES